MRKKARLTWIHKIRLYSYDCTSYLYEKNGVLNLFSSITNTFYGKFNFIHMYQSLKLNSEIQKTKKNKVW